VNEFDGSGRVSVDARMRLIERDVGAVRGQNEKTSQSACLEGTPSSAGEFVFDWIALTK
jgi:hypothetical protein